MWRRIRIGVYLKYWIGFWIIIRVHGLVFRNRLLESSRLSKGSTLNYCSILRMRLLTSTICILSG